MGLEYDFEGIKNRLETMQKKLSVIDVALDEAKKPILKKMKSEVPKDTWELHNVLGEIERRGNGLNRKIVLGIDSNDRNIIERGYYQEYGHSRMLGKKWMKRSFQLAKSEANKAILESLRRQLKK